MFTRSAPRDFVLIQHKRRSPAEGKAEPLELLEIVERVDVVLELDDRGQAEACGGEAGSAAGAVGGREPGAIGQRERVGRPIRCRDVGGSELLEPRERGRCEAGKVGVDDEAGSFGSEQRGLHRRSLAAAGIGDHARPERTRGRSRRRVVGDEAHVVAMHHRRLEHVAEHGEREVDAEVVREPALAARAERDDDRCHRCSTP